MDDRVLRFLADTNTVAVITTRADGVEVATPIWAVVIDGVPYLRSEHGADAKWWRRALSGRPIAFSLEDGKVAEWDPASSLRTERAWFAVESIPEQDPIVGRISDAIREKYVAEPESVASMTRPISVACNVRVVAA